jgi:hypothetical protein
MWYDAIVSEGRAASLFIVKMIHVMVFLDYETM